MNRNTIAKMLFLHKYIAIVVFLKEKYVCSSHKVITFLMTPNVCISIEKEFTYEKYARNHNASMRDE